MMIERVGVHRAHQADLVGDLAQVREVIGNLHAALAARREFAMAGQNGRRRLDEGELQILSQRRGQRLAVPLFELRLRVEQIELAGSALHEHEDDVLGLWREHGRLWRERTQVRRGPVAFALQQIGERQRADPARAVSKEAAPRLDFAILLEIHMIIPG